MIIVMLLLRQYELRTGFYKNGRCFLLKEKKMRESLFFFSRSHTIVLNPNNFVQNYSLIANKLNLT